MRDLTYIVLLNWRGAGDTIACLCSLLNSEDTRFKIIVCDNDSGDSSLEAIGAWAQGQGSVDLPADQRLARLVEHPTKALPYRQIDEAQALSGQWIIDTALTLVANKHNGGFARGNNVGIRLAMAQPDMHSVWLLNNDTLVEPDCLGELRRCLDRWQGRAVIGSRIHFFDDPSVIQALGGNPFNRLTGVAGQSLKRYQAEQTPRDIPEAESSLHYISGCSMLLPRDFLREVGLMNEDYFLYYEEIDWFTRAGERFPCRIADGAVLYHREGAAIGSANWGGCASPFSEYHMYRSRLLFMRRYHPLFLPTTFLRGAAEAALRFLQGRRANASAILRSISGLALSPDLRP